MCVEAASAGVAGNDGCARQPPAGSATSNTMPSTMR